MLVHKCRWCNNIRQYEHSTILLWRYLTYHLPHPNSLTLPYSCSWLLLSTFPPLTKYPPSHFPPFSQSSIPPSPPLLPHPQLPQPSLQVSRLISRNKSLLHKTPTHQPTEPPTLLKNQNRLQHRHRQQTAQARPPSLPSYQIAREAARAYGGGTARGVGKGGGGYNGI